MDNLKFLIPKLVVKIREDELIDDLIESVDLSTYGLERTKVNQSIALDEAGSEWDSQNTNPRSAHGTEEEKDPLGEIIRTFNDRFFAGWNETPEEARVKLATIAKNVMAHPDCETKVANNADTENKDLALKKIMNGHHAQTPQSSRGRV